MQAQIKTTPYIGNTNPHNFTEEFNIVNVYFHIIKSEDSGEAITCVSDSCVQKGSYVYFSVHHSLSK